MKNKDIHTEILYIYHSIRSFASMSKEAPLNIHDIGNYHLNRAHKRCEKLLALFEEK